MMKIGILLKSGVFLTILSACFITSSYARITAPTAYAQDKIVALWLFDEPNIQGVALADLSMNRYNLSLGPAARLVPGKFGNALEINKMTGLAANYTSGIHRQNLENPVSNPDDDPIQNLLSAPDPMLELLKKGNWTIEFWLQISQVSVIDSVIIDIGRTDEAGFQIGLTAGGKNFQIRNSYNSFQADCPTDTDKLTDGKWHHIAFVHYDFTGNIRHYIDGTAPAESIIIAAKKTSFKNKMDSLLFIKNDESSNTDNTSQHEAELLPLNITIGHDRDDNRHYIGLIDEIRFTDARRYLANFTPPESGG